MSDTITLRGIVATTPNAITTSEGLAITSFRLASAQRRFDKGLEKWVDAETNWFSITTFRQLATNVAVSVKKGERIVVTGRLRVRDWKNGDKSGTNVDVEAEALGHDLSWGTAAFSRSAGNTSVPADGNPADGNSADGNPADSALPATAQVSFPPSFPASFPTSFPTEAELAVPDDASELANDDAVTPF